LPGCVSTGETLIEVERNMRETIGFHLDGLREQGKPVPEPHTYSAYIELPAGSADVRQVTRSMIQILVPMIHVPDVRATVEWYASIGLEVIGRNEEDGEMNWAKLRFAGSQLTFNAVGKARAAERREVDLYVTAENIDGIFQRLDILDEDQVVERCSERGFGEEGKNPSELIGGVLVCEL
jgi:catechol 2,3-dioxygenase-like lactoylglutathione lyase family enzyme